MHRFFAADAAERETILLDENESKHARSVLRVRDGETAELLDGQGRRFGAQIDGTENGRVRVRRLTELPGNEPEVRVTLYPGLPKLDKLDFVVQKAAELGAARVVPVEMERSVARISGDGAKKRERWERIAREAAKQCGRGACRRYWRRSRGKRRLWICAPGNFCWFPGKKRAWKGSAYNRSLPRTRPRATLAF